MDRKILLKGRQGALSVVWDEDNNTGSIAISDGYKPQFKWISKELYDLLVKELETQEYVEI